MFRKCICNVSENEIILSVCICNCIRVFIRMEILIFLYLNILLSNGILFCCMFF